MHGLSELRGRLNNLGTGETKSTSHKLLSKVVAPTKSTSESTVAVNGTATNGVKSVDVSNDPASTETETLSSLDHRLGELELLIGASNATLDEVSLHQPSPEPLQLIIPLYFTVITSAPTPPPTYQPTLEHPFPSYPTPPNRRCFETSQTAPNRTRTILRRPIQTSTIPTRLFIFIYTIVRSRLDPPTTLPSSPNHTTPSHSITDFIYPSRLGIWILSIVG